MRGEFKGNFLWFRTRGKEGGKLLIWKVALRKGFSTSNIFFCEFVKSEKTSSICLGRNRKTSNVEGTRGDERQGIAQRSPYKQSSERTEGGKQNSHLPLGERTKMDKWKNAEGRAGGAPKNGVTVGD